MGPLDGIKVVELGGLGPAPLCAMMLSDMGAEVVRIDRPSAIAPPALIERQYDLLTRGRKCVAVDLKNPKGVETVLRLIEKADAFIEGYRPGVTERLGLGPEDCQRINPRLVYGRMTGWGQDGPLAGAAGHDINYISLTGALNAIGPPERPVIPLNLVADFGGGGMYLAFGLVSALLEATRSGKGQVVDAAMVDGVASLMASVYGRRAGGLLGAERGMGQIDGGAHYYNVYETKDGKFISIGPIEPQFFALLLKHTGLTPEELPDQHDQSHWPEMKEKFRRIFKEKTRDEWCAIMEGSDICFAPVLDIDEATEHPHLKARGTFVEVGNMVQPAPAPRFSRTPGAIQGPPADPGTHTDETLANWGFSKDEIADLHEAGAID